MISGRKGAISDDRWLIANYDPAFYGIPEKHLKNSDERVRYETILLLTTLKERNAADRVKEMRITDSDKVSMACLGYITTMGDNDNLIPQLIDTLEYKRGAEFKKAAERIGSIGRSQDINVLRRIYGQVTGDMRIQIRDAMIGIIDRDPELKKKKELLLSVPVFPDETKFDRFLRTGKEYIDVRYRNSVHPRPRISAETYSNVARGIKDIRTRLFNESSNLNNYPDEYTTRYNELVDLLAWSVSDLSSKEILHNSADKNILCGRCGSPMIMGKDAWMCLDCGNRVGV